MEKSNTFEDYLQEKHADQYIGVGGMPDDCNDWLCQLDPQELMDYGELYGMERFNAGLKEAQRMIDETFGHRESKHYQP